MKRSNDKDYKRLSKMLAKWRKKTSTLLYRMGKEEGVRWDYLKGVEEGKSVTAVTLLAYLHFCHSHGYNPLSDLWPDDTPTTTVDSPTSGTFDGSADGSVDDVDDDVVETSVSTSKTVPGEEGNGEHKGVCETSDSDSEPTPETTLDSTPSQQPSFVPQYNKLYHVNTYNDTSTETSDSLSNGSVNNVVNDVAEASVSSTDSTSKDDKKGERKDEYSVSGTTEDTNKINMFGDLDSMSPDQEKQFEKYIDTLRMQECQEPLYAEHQRILISFGHTCPNCGGRLKVRINKQKNTPFIGCENWKPGRKGCNYTANGDFDNPELNDDYLPTLVPNLELNPGS